MSKVIDINATLHFKILNNISRHELVKSIKPIYDQSLKNVRYEIRIITDKIIYTDWNSDWRQLNGQLIELMDKKFCA